MTPVEMIAAEKRKGEAMRHTPTLAWVVALGLGNACVRNENHTKASNYVPTSLMDSEAQGPTEQQLQCVAELKSRGAEVLAEKPTLNANADWPQQLDNMVLQSRNTEILHFHNYTNSEVYWIEDKTVQIAHPHNEFFLHNLGLNQLTTGSQNWVLHVNNQGQNFTPTDLNKPTIDVKTMKETVKDEAYFHFPRDTFIKTEEQLSLFRSLLKAKEKHKGLKEGSTYEAALWLLKNRSRPVYFWKNHDQTKLDAGYVLGLRFTGRNLSSLSSDLVAILARDDAELLFPARLIVTLNAKYLSVVCKHDEI